MISEPVNGATLKADEQENDVYTTAVMVRGVAEPDARVVVSTGCKDEVCQKAVRTASDGAFEAKVEPHGGGRDSRAARSSSATRTPASPSTATA